MSYSQPEKSLALANGIVRKATRILLIDDHSLSGGLLKTQLKPEPNLVIVGTVATEAEVFTAIKQLLPDLVVIDFEMPGINGYSITQKIHYHFPELKIVVFTNRNQSDHLNQALSMGANGFLFKNSHTEEVKNVIRAITSVSFHNLQLQLAPAGENASKGDSLIAQSDYSNSGSSEIVHLPSTLPAVVAEREDWSAATKDLLDALPQIWTRSLLYMLVIGTAIILPWSILTEVDQTGTARGRLEPKDKIIRLDAPVAGKIETILVKEGDTVKAGAILAELESELANSELEQLNEKRSGLLQRLTQLELMQNQSIATLTTQEQQNQSRQLEKQSQLEQAQQNLDTLQALYKSQKDEKLAQLEQAKQAIDFKKAAQKQANITLAGSIEKAKRYQQAFEDGVIDQDRFKDVQQVAKENQERLMQARSETEQVESRLKEQQSNYDNFIKNAQAEIEQASLRLEEQKRSSQTLVSTGQIEKLKVEVKI
jgi:hemolysin D